MKQLIHKLFLQKCTQKNYILKGFFRVRSKVAYFNGHTAVLSGKKNILYFARFSVRINISKLTDKNAYHNGHTNMMVAKYSFTFMK